jgi:exopolysaccharide biosynthesis protein
MKRLLAISAILTCFLIQSKAQTPDDSTAFYNAEWQVKKLGKGAEAVTVHTEMFGSPQHVTFIRYPMKRFRTEILHRPGKKAGKTSALASEAGARFAINGGYFNGKHEPISFFRTDEGVHCDSTYARGEKRINGALCISRNGKKILIKECHISEHDSSTKKYGSVITCGPLLMDEGKISHLRDSVQSFVFKRHPRTVFGYDDKGYAYMIVIDGRHKGQAAGATIPEAAFIARILGLEAALNLDGGGSSALWSDATGVLNYPCDNKTFDHQGERRVPNIIIAR